jgi:hypothetical protein
VLSGLRDYFHCESLIGVLRFQIHSGGQTLGPELRSEGLLPKFVLALACVATAILAVADDITPVVTPSASTPPIAIVSAPPLNVIKPEPIHIVLDGARKPGDCLLEGEAVRKEVQTLPFPPGWKIAIMCTPVRWATLIEQVNPPRTHTAFTSLNQRITVLNGAIFHDFPLRYRHTMAHELAHIQCECTDEGYAEKLADELEKEQGSRNDADRDRDADTNQATK